MKAGQPAAWVAESVRQSPGEGAAATGVDPSAVASFLIAVCDGFVWQWLLDPDETPSGEHLLAALGAALTLATPVAGEPTSPGTPSAPSGRPR